MKVAHTLYYDGCVSSDVIELETALNILEDVKKIHFADDDAIQSIDTAIKWLSDSERRVGDCTSFTDATGAMICFWFVP